MTAVATSNSTVLALGLREDTNGDGIDDISVIQSVPAASTPEPGAYALLASLGLTGAALLRRKKFRG